MEAFTFKQSVSIGTQDTNSGPPLAYGQYNYRASSQDSTGRTGAIGIHTHTLHTKLYNSLLETNPTSERGIEPGNSLSLGSGFAVNPSGRNL